MINKDLWKGYRTLDWSGINPDLACSRCFEAWGDGCCLICGNLSSISTIWIKPDFNREWKRFIKQKGLGEELFQ